MNEIEIPLNARDAGPHVPTRAHPRSIYRLQLGYQPPVALRRFWPFIWHRCAAAPCGQQIADLAGLHDADLRRIVVDAISTWQITRPAASDADLAQECVVINILDAATAEQDRRDTTDNVIQATP